MLVGDKVLLWHCAFISCFLGEHWFPLGQDLPQHHYLVLFDMLESYKLQVLSKHMESSLEDDIAHGCCFDAWRFKSKEGILYTNKNSRQLIHRWTIPVEEKTGTISNRKVENFKGLWSHVNPRPTAILSLLSLFYCRIFKTFGTPILKENKIAIWAQ